MPAPLPKYLIVGVLLICSALAFCSRSVDRGIARFALVDQIMGLEHDGAFDESKLPHILKSRESTSVFLLANHIAGSMYSSPIQNLAFFASVGVPVAAALALLFMPARRSPPNEHRDAQA